MNQGMITKVFSATTAVLCLGSSSVFAADTPSQKKDLSAFMDYTAFQESTTTPVEQNFVNSLPASGPLSRATAYVVGFHPMVDHPDQQMMVHHFCTVKTANFIQCVLFDGNSPGANMTGIEYILSKEAYEKLPAEEKRLWHPHNAEVLSGELHAPGLTAQQEHDLMAMLMNSYGKTWHTWMSKPTGEEAVPVPLGEPMLAWSFNKKGEAKAEMLKERDALMNVSTDELSKARQDLIPLAEPQCGVDRLNKYFSNAEAIPGVTAKDSALCYGQR